VYKYTNNTAILFSMKSCVLAKEKKAETHF